MSGYSGHLGYVQGLCGHPVVDDANKLPDDDPLYPCRKSSDVKEAAFLKQLYFLDIGTKTAILCVSTKK